MSFDLFLGIYIAIITTVVIVLVIATCKNFFDSYKDDNYTDLFNSHKGENYTDSYDNSESPSDCPNLNYDEREISRAGEKGEYLAASAIASILYEGDWHIRNFAFSVDDREAECDVLVVNTNGIFVFEVKNYTGVLSGGEADYTWEKVKESDGGNLYSKEIKNPIKQVKRQVWLLKELLESYGIYDFWIDGYVLLVNANPHDESEYILTDLSEVERIIHKPGKRPLNKSKKDAVISAINMAVIDYQAA